jgi:hypothetical protein
MTRKKFLAIMTMLTMAIGLVLASLPLFYSLKPNAKANTDHEPIVVYLKNLQVGVPFIIESRGRPLIVLKPTDSQKANIQLLNEYVANPETGSYFPEHDLYIYWGLGKKNGYYCLVRHHPKPRYEGQKWKGGYLSLPCDISYDYAGRAIKDRDFSYIGYGGNFANLQAPREVFVSMGELRVSR